jgi:acyl-[acyl-carrier-protein]-phospholipid O-acyltransferase/long-chain-fatty-acid--[acyl-carrier-protein] ligase
LPTSLLIRLFGKSVNIHSPAAILFSSGSEGEPKGVILSHQNIMGNIKQVSDVLDIRDEDVMVASLPLFHAFGLTVTGLLPLIEGVPAICHPDPTDVLNISKGICQHQATIFCGTSTFLRLFTKNSRIHPLMLDSLRIVVAGAERLNPEIRDSFSLKFGKTIYEGYGTTETTPVATVNLPDRIGLDDWKIQTGDKKGTVGLPLPGSSVRIVDPDTLKSLANEEDGLILIGGTQVMQGYLNDPDKTADVLVEIDGHRWYKTGDKGHLDKDGFLIIVDRYSRFAKIGGEMISLGAIEVSINANLPENIEILATTVPDDKKGEKVVLLYSGQIEDEELKACITNSTLNSLMMPSLLIEVDAIPKLGSGKSDFNKAKKIAIDQLNTPKI